MKLCDGESGFKLSDDDRDLEPDHAEHVQNGN